MSIADIGSGSTVEFLTSGRVFEVKSIRPDGPSRSIHDVTTLATANLSGGKTYREKIAGRVLDAGRVVLECHFDPTMTCPVLDADESVRITSPVPSGKSTGHIWAFTAAVVSSPRTVEIDALTMWTVTLEILGAVTETAAA